MTDTLTRERGVTTDTVRYRLTREAVERAKSSLGLPDDEAVAKYLDVSLSTFYRMLRGAYPISLDKAAPFARDIKWSITRAFKPVNDSARDA